jgi:hypothetical protein
MGHLQEIPFVLRALRGSWPHGETHCQGNVLALGLGLLERTEAWDELSRSPNHIMKDRSKSVDHLQMVGF